MRSLAFYIALLSCVACTVSRGAVPAGNAVLFRGTVFVGLDELLSPAALDGNAALSRDGRSLEVRVGDRLISFDEGGDRVAIGGGPAQPLTSPLLVLGGKYFVPVGECARVFGYSVEGKPPSALRLRDRRLVLRVGKLEPPHLRTRVEDLRPVRRAVTLTAPLAVRPHLHTDVPPVSLRPAITLAVRREATLDGVPHAIVTRADETLESYAVPLKELNAASRSASLDGTHLGRVFAKLSDLAADEAAIEHGRRETLPRAVSLTIDMCWSLRPFEEDLFASIPTRGARDGNASATFFMTGRWMQQHPDEMGRLIALSRQPGVNVIWGLHSWVHPKQRPFMNGYTPEQVRDDNLRLERHLLEWGIVPSIYYRFPGLIHDEPRLRAILALDLIAVDCDSWVASMRRDRPPHHLRPSDGSILLVHGNSNEPVGIERFNEWLAAHDDWRWEPLHRFISAEPQPRPTTTSRPASSRPSVTR